MCIIGKTSIKSLSFEGETYCLYFYEDISLLDGLNTTVGTETRISTKKRNPEPYLPNQGLSTPIPIKKDLDPNPPPSPDFDRRALSPIT